MGKKRRKNTKRSQRGRTSTSLKQHAKEGKKLFPPLAKIGKVVPVSWMNDRLPEMIWAGLIHESAGRDIALNFFRRCINFIGEHAQRSEFHDITLTGLSKAEPDSLKEFISFLTSEPAAGNALATLRLFESLPARALWDELLPSAPADLDLLMSAVGSLLWHQSDAATDVRWLRIMASIAAGKFIVPPEMAKEWFGYSGQRELSGRIRASEIVQDLPEPRDRSWPIAFWKEGLENTPCLDLAKLPARELDPNKIVPRRRISEVARELDAHWARTLSTTAVDARHDAVFGMAAYSLRLLDELMGIGVGTSALGRLAVRTIAEVRINLRYLLSKDSEELWRRWRAYGAGQAKLGSLKFDDLEPPQHIDLASIEHIANEDLWEEFVPIELGSWSGADLRKLSDQGNLKGIYDQHYQWSSGYAHGMWGAVRESCFETCGNPLHRLHRFPKLTFLKDVVDDAVTLVDGVLSDVDAAYPAFVHRLGSA